MPNAAYQNRPINRQIHPMILARRSLREMNGQPVKDEELMSLFEGETEYAFQDRFIYF